MKDMKHWLMTIAVLLCSMAVNAHDFEVDGIYYKITSSTNFTVEVTYRGSNAASYSNEYSGVVTIPSTVTYDSKTYSVTSISTMALYRCSSLKTITIPESVTNIGDEAFEYCENLTTITIPKNSQLTSVGRYAFNSCSSLAAITIPEDVTSIEYGAFYYCSSLTTITIPESVTSIGEAAFNGCSSLTTITIPENSRLTSIGRSAFHGCRRLTAITIPKNVTSIGEAAFNGCSSLTTITIPEGVTSIGDGAFLDCSSLTSITIPEGVTSIGDDAFYYCSSLTAITIPEGVTSIGDRAFNSCSRLTNVYCYAEKVPTTKTDAFNYSNIGNATLHVLASALDAYKTTTPWSSFGKFEILTPRPITITMNQYGSGTYCSEYALDFSEVEGLKAYAATGYNTKTGIVTLTRVMTSQPGMGLFLKGETGEYTVPTLESTDDNSLNMLVGALENTELNGTSDNGLYYNYRYTIKEGDEAPKFYQVDDDYTLGAGKAYLQIPVAWMTTQAKAIGLRFDDGGTTDIDELESESNSQNAELIYDLMGRRVTSPQRGMIYIVNGKKVVMD